MLLLHIGFQIEMMYLTSYSDSIPMDTVHRKVNTEVFADRMVELESTRLHNMDFCHHLDLVC